MRLSTYWVLFRMRLPNRLRKLKRLIKQFFCLHRETYTWVDWANHGLKCKRCDKTRVLISNKDV